MTHDMPQWAYNLYWEFTPEGTRKVIPVIKAITHTKNIDSETYDCMAEQLVAESQGWT